MGCYEMTPSELRLLRIGLIRAQLFSAVVIKTLPRAVHRSKMFAIRN